MGGPDQTEEPLVVEGNTLSVKDADQLHAEIDLRGTPATASAAGMSMQAEKVRINRGSGNVWIDSPGELELLLDRDLRGNVLPVPQPLTITWQQNMELDNGRITFRGKVRALSSDGVLDTQRMVAVLDRPLDFNDSSSGQQAKIEQLECHEGVQAQFQERDQFGLTSSQVMELESITVNQISGKISGQGPGELESVHLSSGKSPLQQLKAGDKRGGQENFRAFGQKLGYLHVKFRRGVVGNLHHRVVEVVGDARAVYGPVDSWEQKLAMSLSGTPGPDTIWITSDRIGVAQNPQARAQGRSGSEAVELSATGKVIIEGPAGQRGSFTARAKRASYDQAKTMFVLEGDNERPATLIHQEYIGAPRSEQSARKVIYVQKTGEVKLEGVIKGEWNHIDLGTPPAAPGKPGLR